MSSPSPRPHSKTSAASPPEWLSAAADGDADALDRALRALREGDGAASRVRADWHVYHLIGDVLRTPDLATPPGHDAAFMAGLRERLAAEPVVLTPAALRVETPRAARWRLPVAAVASAAGVAVVAGLLV
ncbi:MAG: RseA family anti-sigma factor, partial [Rubrivivax sp.]